MRRGSIPTLPIIRPGALTRDTPEYRAWSKMLGRCYCETDRVYHHYGGRGITVCERWRHDFAAFFEDLGHRPAAGMSLDRIDVNGNYEPGNVRWATAAVQGRNRRMTILSMEKAREIRRLARAGMTEHGIARVVGITRASVHLVIKNKTWKEDADAAPSEAAT